MANRVGCRLTPVLIRGILLCCILCFATVGVTGALDFSLTTTAPQMVRVTTSVVPTYITCPAEYQCLLPNQADTLWGTGMYTQITTGACGAVPIYDSGKVLKYCYKQNAPSVPLLPLEPVRVIPIKADTCKASGKTQCAGNCVDTQTDRGNCGACGNKCPLASSCKAGACSAPIAVEATDKCKLVGRTTNCDGNCYDITSDVFNCGACDNICDQGFKCINGQCSLGCAAGLDECRYDCVNLKTDPNNCGDCGNSCGTNQICSNGLCKCKGDMLICDPNVGCSDVDSNPKQCGSCNNVCSPLQTCVQGQCKSLCDINPSTLSSFSWTNWQGTDWMTPVRDQQGCGSCWAFGPIGSAEAMYNIEHGKQKNLNLSEQELTSPCYGKGDAGSCTGGWYSKALGYMTSGGLVSETNYPYLSVDEVVNDPNGHLACKVTKSHCSTPVTCVDSTLSQTRWKITSSGEASGSVHDVKQALLCHGPLVVGSDNWWHAVVLVGWNDLTGKWTIKNSWGTDPNYNGYDEIAYYGDDFSDIINDVAWVQGVTGP